jgi:hypothetical protein
MPWFGRRNNSRGNSDGPPSFAVDALRRVGVRGVSFRSTDAFGDRANAWAVEVPGDRALTLWSELASDGEHWSPVILGSAIDETRLAESRQYCTVTPDEILEAASRIDVDVLIATWQANNELDDEWDYVGQWPDGVGPNTSFVLPYDIGTRQHRATVLAIVAVRDSTEVPAALGWGAWNACPSPEEHVAVMRRWSDRYGAQLVGISSDVVEMKVSSPPKDREAAMQLAGEQFAYCEDIVTQGTETISALAATLLNGTSWYFWWD